VTAIIVLTLLAFAFLAFLGYQIRKRYFGLPDGHVVPCPSVDLEAFRNLTDPQEERFLRVRLSKEDFRRVQRLRLRAAAQYVAALSQGAADLVQMGQEARRDPDPQIAASGEKLLQDALRLKARCFTTQWRLSLAVLCPTLLSPTDSVIDSYLRVSALANTLPDRIAA